MTSLKEFTTPVLLEMLKDRGYTEVEEDYDGLVGSNNSRGFDDIIVSFVDQEKVSVEIVRQIAKMVQDDNFTRCMLVFINQPSPQVKTFLNDSELNINVELFGKFDLGFNVTKHILVPKHTLLQDDERKAIGKLYGFKNIPQIKLNDPLSKYYGAKRGDIFHITRKIGMTYRIVV